MKYEQNTYRISPTSKRAVIIDDFHRENKPEFSLLQILILVVTSRTCVLSSYNTLKFAFNSN